MHAQIICQICRLMSVCRCSIVYATYECTESPSSQISTVQSRCFLVLTDGWMDGWVGGAARNIHASGPGLDNAYTCRAPAGQCRLQSSISMDQDQRHGVSHVSCVRRSDETRHGATVRRCRQPTEAQGPRARPSFPRVAGRLALCLPGHARVRYH
jgi:hypothetical protein